MFRLFVNHVQIGTYETADELNRSVRNAFAYARVSGMELVVEGDGVSVVLAQEDRGEMPSVRAVLSSRTKERKNR